MDYFEHRAPCDPSLIGKFRKLIGEEGVEELLAKTIAVAVNLKLISKKALETVVVDTTVQPKAVAHPTDSRLLEVCRAKLVGLAKAAALSSNKPLSKKARR
jgi:IS5 family transposase